MFIEAMHCIAFFMYYDYFSIFIKGCVLICRMNIFCVKLCFF